MEQQTILVDLDSLLDTRIATLSRINDKAAAALLRGDYRTRTTDNFEELCDKAIDNEEYQALYQKRDKETLMLARPTEMTFILKDLVEKLETQKIDAPFAERIVVELNLYPYSELTEEERHSMTLTVGAFTSPETVVKYCYLSPEELTPGVIKRNYDAVIHYGFNEWFKLHQEELKTVLTPSVVFFSPALYLDKEPSEEEMQVEGLEGLTPFEILEMSMVERLKLELLEPKYFSILKL